MDEARKARLRQLMKERWADPVQRKQLLRGVRRGAKKGREIQAQRRAAKAKRIARPARRVLPHTPTLRRELRGLANGSGPKLDVGNLRERWSGLILAELNQQVQALIKDAATVAGIKPAELSRRLIKLLQK